MVTLRLTLSLLLRPCSPPVVTGPLVGYGSPRSDVGTDILLTSPVPPAGL